MMVPCPRISSDSGGIAPPGFACFTLSRTASSRQAFKRVGRGHKLAAAVGSTFEFDLALRKPLRPDQDLPRNTDQVGGDEFRARPFFKIVVENLDALGAQLAIQDFRCCAGFGIALLKIEDRNAERCDGLRPPDTSVVMKSLDDGGDEACRPDAVGAHMDRVFAAVGT